MKYEWTEEELAALGEPEQWDWDSAQVVHPEPGRPHFIRLTIKLDREAVEALGPAARAAGVPLPEYVLEAALARAREGIPAKQG